MSTTSLCGGRPSSIFEHVTVFAIELENGRRLLNIPNRAVVHGVCPISRTSIFRSNAVGDDDATVVGVEVTHMAAHKGSTVPAKIRLDLASLKRRVSWLEAALKPKPDKPAIDRAAAGSKRETAEREARHKALMEYYRKRHEERLQRSPFLLNLERECEDSESAFLKSRGFKPDPSRIPKSLRTKAR